MARIEDITFSKNYLEVQHDEFYFKAFINNHNYEPKNYDIVDVQIHSQALDCWLSTDNAKAYNHAQDLLEKALNQVKEENINYKENAEYE